MVDDPFVARRGEDDGARCEYVLGLTSWSIETTGKGVGVGVATAVDMTRMTTVDTALSDRLIVDEIQRRMRRRSASGQEWGEQDPTRAGLVATLLLGPVPAFWTVVRACYRYLVVGPIQVDGKAKG